MNLQSFASAAGGRAGHRQHLEGGEMLHIARQPGELRVVDGWVWLTRPDDLDDHVLRAGESMHLERGRGVLVESWNPAEGATVQWVPEPHRRRLALARAAALGRLSAWTGALGHGLEALGARLGAAAGGAASNADRARGCTTEPVTCGGGLH